MRLNVQRARGPVQSRRIAVAHMGLDRAKAAVQPLVTGQAPGYLPGSRSLDGLAPNERDRVWPGITVDAEGARDLVGLWRVPLVPETND